MSVVLTSSHHRAWSRFNFQLSFAHPPGTCSDATLVAIADEIPAVKPNVLTAPNLAAGTYTLMIEYFGHTGSQTTETVTFTIVLSALS